MLLEARSIVSSLGTDSIRSSTKQIETVVKSVNKTGRCIVVHEAVKTGGVGSELAAEIQERCFLRLESPVQRITGWDTPFGLAYEKFYLPDQLRIVSCSLVSLPIGADFISLTL